jgi:hypothetical protein
MTEVLLKTKYMSALMASLIVLILLSSLGISTASKPENLTPTNISEQQSSRLSSQGLRVSQHKITSEEINELNSQVEANQDRQNYNKLVNGHGTGLSALTSQDLNAIAENAYIIDSISYQASPSRVDNSATPWFPPIGDQGVEGSCAAWAVGYYVKTFQEAKEHSWDLSGASWEGGTYGYPTISYQDKIMSPDFVYHLVNEGLDGGTTFERAIDLVCFVGASSWQKMPYNPLDHTSWPSEAAWTEAAYYRGDSSTRYEYLYANTNPGVTSLKNWLASGNLALIAIDANNYVNLTSGDFWTTNNYRTVDLNHANTIVGYDDSITYMEDGALHTGGFKIANSWGIGGWEKVNDGFYWISYQAMKQLSVLGNPCVLFNDLINYQPELTASFKINHNKRGECGITIGFGTPNKPYASKVFSDYVLGGNSPFCPNNIVLDITEFKQYMTSLYNQPFFMSVYDSQTSTTGTITYFAVGNSASVNTPKATLQNNMVSLTVNYSLATPTLTVLPTFGVAGDNVDLEGTNFTANSTVNLSYLNPNTNMWIPIANNIPTSQAKNFTYTLNAPDLNQSNPAGDHPASFGNIFFAAKDNNNGYTFNSSSPFAQWRRGLTSVGNINAAGLFGNNTNLTSKVLLQEGQEIVVCGRYFGQGSLTAFCDSIFNMGSVLVDDEGNFNASLTMPSQVSAGPHSITLNGAGRNFTFTITRLPKVMADYDGSWHSADYTVNLSADGDGVSEIYYRLNGAENRNVSVNGQPRITLEGNSNTLEYWGIWSNGNDSIELAHANLAGIKLDKTLPEGSIQINGNATYSATSTVTLTVTASDLVSGIQKVRFSNDGVWDTEPWETFTNSKNWTLTAEDGLKHVYYQIMDNAGLTTSLEASIILDTTKPVVNAGSNRVISSGSKLDFDAAASSDPNGIASYIWSFGDGQNQEGQKVSHVYSVAGSYTVTLEVRDHAGNNASNSITVNVQAQTSVIPEYSASSIVIILFIILVATLVTINYKVKKVNL